MANSINSSAVSNCVLPTVRCYAGIFLPAWEPYCIPLGDRIGRSVVYLLCLLYMFLGVSIIAEKFMLSIEVITSKEKEVQIKRKDGTQQVSLIKLSMFLKILITDSL